MLKLLKLILRGKAGIYQETAFISPFPEAPVVVQLQIVINDEGHDVIAQAFLEEDEPSHAPVAILEGMDRLETDMKRYDFFQGLYRGLYAAISKKSIVFNT